MERPVAPAALWMLLLSLWMLLSLPPVVAKRVVHIPTPITSHVTCHSVVAEALRGLGHQVWVAVPHYLMHTMAVDTSAVAVIPYNTSQNYERTVVGKHLETFFSGMSVDRMSALPTASVAIFHDLLTNEDLERRIREVQADLVVLDNVPPAFTLAVLPYKLHVPFAMMGVAYDVHSMRIPYSSAVNAVRVGMVSSDDMTFFERVKSMVVHAALSVHSPAMPRSAVALYAPDMPPLSNSELLARAELWLLETDHILDFPRPSLPNVRFIGSTATEPARPLPPQLRAWMDSAARGVVLVTFGSAVLHVPRHISDLLFGVFLKLPFLVVFRSNLSSPDPSRVWTAPWLPQNDLLGHPHTKLFVSHCGAGGQYQALFHAVPLLCTPLFADQHYNGHRIRKKGFGEVVDLRSVSQDELLDRILKVAQGPGYKLAMSRASSLYRDQFRSPRQEAAKWLDHVMAYGGSHLRYAGHKVPLYQFLALDVFAFLFTLAALASVLLYCAVCKVCTRWLKRKPKTD